jgi:chemotaxis protein methyltransferase CheR
LENRLGSRLKTLNLTSFRDYYDLLKLSKSKNTEFDYLFEKITTNETSFFRDMKQLGVFKMFGLKQILDTQTKANKKTLNIWCAGCSSGEEPYTLAIMLHEVLGMSILGWKIKITAIDLSPAMITKAKRGLYNDHSLRNTPVAMKNKYFAKEPGGYKVHPKLQKLIDFKLVNLNDNMAVKRIPKSQIVFCRNVIIYFDDDMKKKVINHFYDNLLPDGYLVIGHSESIHKHSRLLKPLPKPGGILYQKSK